MNKDTLQGKTENTIGHVKEAAGNLSGDNELQAEGIKDQAKGHFHEAVGAVKQAGHAIAEGVKAGTATTERES